eukprot:scaffold112918_cov22-Tisochrysis_lutea.AAC.1
MALGIPCLNPELAREMLIESGNWAQAASWEQGASWGRRGWHALHMERSIHHAHLGRSGGWCRGLLVSCAGPGVPCTWDKSMHHVYLGRSSSCWVEPGGCSVSLARRRKSVHAQAARVQMHKVATFSKSLARPAASRFARGWVEERVRA